MDHTLKSQNRDHSGYGLSEWEKALLCNKGFVFINFNVFWCSLVCYIEAFQNFILLDLIIINAKEMLMKVAITFLSVLLVIQKPLTHLPPGQNGRHFTDDIFKCIFVNEKFFILIEISLKFVPKVPIDNNPAVV